jgi:riboflavin biosynthesis pyrimidine reductase
LSEQSTTGVILDELRASKSIRKEHDQFIKTSSKLENTKYILDDRVCVYVTTVHSDRHYINIASDNTNKIVLPLEYLTSLETILQILKNEGEQIVMEAGAAAAADDECKNHE